MSATRARLALVAVTILAAGAPAVAAPHAAAGTRAAASSACADADLLIENAATIARARTALRCLINRDRARRDARSVRSHPDLRRVARRHCASLVAHKYVSHVGRDGRTLRERVARAGYIRPGQTFVVGEAITWVTGSAVERDGALPAPAESAERTAIIRRARYRDIGIGIVLGAPRESEDVGVTLVVVLGRRG